ncbi:MAG: FAD:protein transferase [Frankiaceae bacterium]|nr:FAD:protein transferase [Frankiaceae bacterium]
MRQIMGLPVSLLARGCAARSAEVDAAALRCFEHMAWADEMFSTYKADSAISRMARGELSLDDSPPEVRSVARRCEWARELTGGLFDAVRPDGVWDPSGLVKGWAAEDGLGLLLEVSDVDWCLNAGGDVMATSRSGEPFVVGIEDPLARGNVRATVPCVSGAVATSGTAARGAHIYSPRAAAAASSVSASVSVFGPSLEVADVLATAAIVAGDDWASLVTSVPGYAALQISADGRAHATSGWPGTADTRLQP